MYFTAKMVHQKFQGTQNRGTKYLWLGCFGGGVSLTEAVSIQLKYSSPMDPLGASVHGSLGRRKTTPLLKR